MDLSFFATIVLVIALLAIPTYLIKRFNKGQTFYGIASMIRITKILPLFDNFLFLGKLIDIVSLFGILLGFGVLGADYLFGRKQSRMKRFAVFLTSFIFLFTIFSFILAPLFSSPFTKEFEFLFPFIFALFGFAGFILLMLAISGVMILFKIFAGIKTCPGIAPVIPGVKIPNMPIDIPWYAWIPLFLIMLIHEGCHGIAARRINVSLKSTGLLLAGIFPIGAFVEPDEKELKQKSELKQLLVFAAGPMSNLLAMVFGLIITLFLFSIPLAPLINDLDAVHASAIKSITVSGVSEKISFCGEDFPSPAFGKLEKGMRLLQVNGSQVVTLKEVLEQLPRTPNKEAVFLTDLNGIQKEIFLTSNSLGMFGFESKEILKEGFEFPLAYTVSSLLIGLLAGILLWFILLNFLFAIANFLPLEPFDGGKMVKIILMPYLSFLKGSEKEKEEKLNKIMIRTLLVLLLINALPLFL